MGILIDGKFRMNPKLELQKTLLLPDFPSGSSINFYGGKFYLIGDDANTILILDENYQEVNHIRIFDYPDKRIPKPKKVDFETSSLITLDDKNYLLVKGSASKKKRAKLMLIPLDHEREILETIKYTEFADRLFGNGIQEVNIEGSTIVRNQLVLANRGSGENPINHLIITGKNFWQQQQQVNITASEVVLPGKQNGFIGVSELFYAESKDLLLFTLSSEQTNNSYHDGAIGDSYLGWMDSYSQKIGTSKSMVDGLINLSDVSDAFKGEKIEGICIECLVGNELTIHLISDNDQGQSKLFKIRMTI